MANVIHRLANWVDRVLARARFATRIMSGNYPLPTPIQELNMAAIDDLNKAVSDVTAYVASLQGDLANADQTPAITAATSALRSILPPETAPVDGPTSADSATPQIDPTTGLPVTAA
jgi:hypothetical protein